MFTKLFMLLMLIISWLPVDGKFITEKSTVTKHESTVTMQDGQKYYINHLDGKSKEYSEEKEYNSKSNIYFDK